LGREGGALLDPYGSAEAKFRKRGKRGLRKGTFPKEENERMPGRAIRRNKVSSRFEVGNLRREVFFAEDGIREG